MDGDVSYAYDAAGNRTAKIDPTSGTTLYTLGLGDRLATYGRAASPLAAAGSYAYDTAGNVTHITRENCMVLDLTWDSQYQLVSVTTNGAFAESYAYDAFGRRVSTTTQEGTIRHIYDDRWQCIADVDEQGNVVSSYVWGEGIDNLLAVKVDGNAYYPLTDIQGTVWGYVDSVNNIVARFEYDAWGNLLSATSTIPALARNRYRFQGREWSAVTGLTNFRMRWYDAETGRWLSKDPIGLGGGLNLYVFCGNDAMNYRDPTGLVILPVPFIFRIRGNGPNWHHKGRDARNTNLPVTPPAQGSGWVELPSSQNIFHDNGKGKPERKFIHPDGREAVYDGDTGELVTDPCNKGTYNYVNPPQDGMGGFEQVWRGAGHFFADMVPFAMWGN